MLQFLEPLLDTPGEGEEDNRTPRASLPTALSHAQSSREEEWTPICYAADPGRSCLVIRRNDLLVSVTARQEWGDAPEGGEEEAGSDCPAPETPLTLPTSQGPGTPISGQADGSSPFPSPPRPPASPHSWDSPPPPTRPCHVTTPRDRPLVTLSAHVQAYGPCGLAACGASPSWAFVGWILRWGYLVHYFMLVITFASLAICSTVSVVYAAWLTFAPLGMGSVIMASLPILNLLWILMAFCWHNLCWDVWTDYHNLNECLLVLRDRWPGFPWVWAASFLVNAPVVVLAITCLAAWSSFAPLWLLQVHFWFSFAASVCIAIVFFVGAVIGIDHDPSNHKPPPPPSPPAWLPSFFHPVWRLIAWALFSTIGRALRVYVRSSFTNGGAFNESGSQFGKHSRDFEPQRIDCSEGRAAYAKLWCTPWFLGYYCGIQQSRCLHPLVHLPWILLLLGLVGMTIVVAIMIHAWGLLAVVVAYILILPCIFMVLSRWVATAGHSQRRSGRMALIDLFLVCAVVAAFLGAAIAAGAFLGYAYSLIVIAAGFVTFLVHVPAIRDQRLPPPRGHSQARAFYVRSLCYKCASTARQGGFASIVMILMLVLMIRTVPSKLPTGRGWTGGPHFTSPGLKSGIMGADSTTLSSGGAGLPYIKYPLCYLNFTGLSVMDFGHLSWAAYLDPTYEAQRWVDDHVNPAFKFEVTRLDIAAETGLPYGPIVYQMTDSEAKVLVFAIRGTNELFDCFSDLDIWSECLTVQTAAFLIPLYAAPMFQPYLDKFLGSTTQLVYNLAVIKGLILTNTQASTNRYYYNQLENYLENNVWNHPRYALYQTFFTGHSLGGGVAEVVGARHAKPAVTFSAPGVILSRRKFDISLDAINQWILNVVPQGDVVPMADVQSIKAQTIKCKYNALSIQCHSLETTLDEIASNCYDQDEG